MNQIKVKQNNEISTSGVITVVNWTMASNGLRYLFFYCDRWEIITDSMFPIDGFRSSEHWQLAAMDSNGNTLALFPGCQVKAWIFCESIPKHQESDCYYIK